MSLGAERVAGRLVCVLNQLLQDSCEEGKERVCDDQKHWPVPDPSPSPAPGGSLRIQDSFSAEGQRTHEPGYGAPMCRTSPERGCAGRPRAHAGEKDMVAKETKVGQSEPSQAWST